MLQSVGFPMWCTMDVKVLTMVEESTNSLVLYVLLEIRQSGYGLESGCVEVVMCGKVQGHMWSYVSKWKKQWKVLPNNYRFGMILRDLQEIGWSMPAGFILPVRYAVDVDSAFTYGQLCKVMLLYTGTVGTSYAVFNDGLNDAVLSHKSKAKCTFNSVW